MARFARMYAPFQSIFLWYLVFFLRYTVDRERSALMPMVLLSILGVFTWEGGAILGVANLLPPILNHERGRLRRSDFKMIVGMLILLGVLVAANTDLRGSATEPTPSNEGFGPQDSVVPLSLGMQVYTRPHGMDSCICHLAVGVERSYAALDLGTTRAMARGRGSMRGTDQCIATPICTLRCERRRSPADEIGCA